MNPKPQPPAQCGKCKAPINWWNNANREGRMVAVDQSPDPEKGTVLKMVVGTPPNHQMYAKVLSGSDLAEAVSRREQLFILHSTSCTARRPFNPRPAHVQLDLSIRARSQR